MQPGEWAEMKLVAEELCELIHLAFEIAQGDQKVEFKRL
jgi:hypothetical protein